MKLPEVGANAHPVRGVNIVRKDYFLDERVIIASSRGKRPHQFSKTSSRPSIKKSCPFCPHNQDKIILIDEVPAPGSAYGWSFRSVENLFAAVNPKGKIPNPVIRGSLLDGFFDECEAYGFAEVVIETPEHNLELENRSVDDIASLFKFLSHRVEHLSSKKGVSYVSLFKNRGLEAGASISHSHTQIIATGFVPSRILELSQAVLKSRLSRGVDPFNEVVEFEVASKRLINEGSHFISIAPFASKLPFESWIIPKRHVSNIWGLSDSEIVEAARMVKNLLLKLDTLGKPAYNMLFVTDKPYSPLRFHIRIMPRINIQAGFELGTGTIINPVLPEVAAEFYRGDGS